MLLNNKITTKKLLIAAIAGAFVITGFVATQLATSIATAAPQQLDQRYERQNYTPEQHAQNIQDCFGIDKQTLLDYNDKGWKFSDLHRAAFIAYAGQQDFATVLSTKTVTNNWKDVSAALGITREQYRAAHNRLISNRLAARLALNVTTITDLITQGYHPRDIAMAATLAKQSEQTLDSILAMKKINNRWSDVAASLGLSPATFKQCRQTANDCFGNKYNLGNNSDNNFRHNGERNFHDDDFYRHHRNVQ